MTQVFVRTSRVLQGRDGRPIVVRKEVKRVVTETRPASDSFDEEEEVIMPAAHVIGTHFSRRAASALAEGLSSRHLRSIRGRHRG